MITHRPRHLRGHRRDRPSGFTLVELVATMVIVSILALAAAPAIARLQRLRDNALAREVERRLSLARATALATGLPTGVRFDTAGQTMPLLRIASTGAAPSTMPSITGAAGSASDAGDSIEAMYAGSTIVSTSIGAGGTADTLWFSFSGTPHTRNAGGSFLANLSADATITLSGGHTITVRRLTGLIER